MVTEVVLERVNVNDDDHVLVAWLVKDGAHVERGAPIAEIETSKAAVELEAATSGRIAFLAAPGETVRVGAPIYRIGGADAAGAAAPATEGTGSAAPSSFPEAITPAEEPARADDAPVPAHKGFRTARPYREPGPVRGRPPLPAPPSSSSGEWSSVAIGARPRPYVGDDPRKAAEVAALSVVNPSGLVSCLFARCAPGTRIAGQDGLFEANLSDLLIYETSRLVRAYPLINAFYDEENGLSLSEEVEFGYSIDVADDLTVYNLGACQAKSLHGIREAIESAMEAHATRKIARDQLKPTTITLTDLSGSGVRHFYPLINGRQSSILGYSTDEDGATLLSFAFDHRAMGGRYAARFLADLVERLASHLRSPSPTASSAETIACAFCGRDAATLADLRERGLLRILTPSGEDALCCETCFVTT